MRHVPKGRTDVSVQHRRWPKSLWPSQDPIGKHIEEVEASASTSRSLAILLLGFGALAVGVGSVGVYSLIAYVVGWRTREIGIRLALGAPR
jgi:ABC-type antimicrobial peptide transport system permease subunit